MDRHHAKAINYRSAFVGNGFASARRWIYKQRVESVGAAEYRRSARILIKQSRKIVR